MSDRKPGTVSQILINGRKYLGDEDNWCQHKSRIATGMWLRRHERFCATGYIAHKTSSRELSQKAMEFLSNASWECYGRSPIYVNDNHGHEAVLRVYDKAIFMALSKGV